MQQLRALALGALFAAIPMLSMAVPPCCAGEEEGCGRPKQQAPWSTADHVPEAPESCPVLPTGECAAAAVTVAAEKARSDGAAGLTPGPPVVSRARARVTPGRKVAARRRSTPPVPLYVTLNSFLI